MDRIRLPKGSHKSMQNVARDFGYGIEVLPHVERTSKVEPARTSCRWVRNESTESTWLCCDDATSWYMSRLDFDKLRE